MWLFLSLHQQIGLQLMFVYILVTGKYSIWSIIDNWLIIDLISSKVCPTPPPRNGVCFDWSISLCGKRLLTKTLGIFRFFCVCWSYKHTTQPYVQNKLQRNPKLYKTVQCLSLLVRFFEDSGLPSTSLLSFSSHSDNSCCSLSRSISLLSSSSLCIKD